MAIIEEGVFKIGDAIEFRVRCSRKLHRIKAVIGEKELQLLDHPSLEINHLSEALRIEKKPKCFLTKYDSRLKPWNAFRDFLYLDFDKRAINHYPLSEGDNSIKSDNFYSFPSTGEEQPPEGEFHSLPFAKKSIDLTRLCPNCLKTIKSFYLFDINSYYEVIARRGRWNSDSLSLGKTTLPTEFFFIPQSLIFNDFAISHDLCLASNYRDELHVRSSNSGFAFYRKGENYMRRKGFYQLCEGLEDIGFPQKITEHNCWSEEEIVKKLSTFQAYNIRKVNYLEDQGTFSIKEF